MSQEDSHIPTPDSSPERVNLAEIHGGLPTGFGQLLWHILHSTAVKYPERDAIVALHGDLKPSDSTAGVSSQRWSYKELLARVDAVAHRLGHLDCGGAGSSLVVVTRNIAEWGLLFWIAAKLGMAFVPIDPDTNDNFGAVLSTAAPQVIAVENDDLAQKVDSWVRKEKKTHLTKILVADGTRDSWFSLSQIQYESYKLCQMKCQFDGLRVGGSGSMALVIFTSGTTGTPKACVHTHDNIVSQTHDFDPNPDPAFVDRWLIHTPVHHIFAINNALRAWRMGGAVILPSPTFSVQTSLRALVEEQCTIMSATPTLLKTILGHKNCPDASLLNLSIISLASTVISPDDIRLCKQSLGCRDAIQAYGMSESGPVVSWCRDDSLLVGGFHPGVGKVLPGASIRVCLPGTQDILSVGEVGELHISGPSVISRYLVDELESSFYMDNGSRWLVTGDQAKIDDDGVVYILGRYKDLIIRGGENIDPAIIEARILTLSGIEVQVVGCQDEVAGEIPIAIVKRHSNISHTTILKKSRALGPKYTLAGIYDLSQLGFQEMPVTSLKKPRRQLLKVALREFLNAQVRACSRHPQVQSTSIEHSTIVEKLGTIWEDLCGVRPEPGQSVHIFADSIMLLQYCDRVFRALQVPLYLQDLFDYKDVSAQASLLLRRRSSNAPWPEAVSNSQPQMRGSHNKTFSANADYSAELSSVSKQTLPPSPALDSTISLRANQYRMVEGQRPQSYHIRLTYSIQALSVANIKEALRTLIVKTPSLSSLLVRTVATGKWQLVPCNDGLDASLVHESQAESEDKLRSWISRDSVSSLCLPQVFRADIIKCLDTKNHILKLHLNHVAVDAMSLWAILRNLDDILHDGSGAAHIAPSVSFGLWADLYQQNRANSLARDNITHLTSRLRGISRFPDALWPPQRAPGWMIGDDSASMHFAARNTARETVWNGEWKTTTTGATASASSGCEFYFPRRGRIVRLPQLAALQIECGITPDVLARCALILFNVRQTGSPYAVFNSWEAARSWPFVPDWVQAHLPPAMAIDGPTTQWRLNMYSAGNEAETALAFLTRIQSEEVVLAAHNHAPWDDVKTALGEEAGIAEDASFRQGFVWDVTLGMSAQSRRKSNFKVLEPISRHDWPDCGIFWNAFMVDKENMYFIASWDTAQMNADEIDRHCDLFAEILRALANANNRGRPLKEVVPPVL